MATVGPRSSSWRSPLWNVSWSRGPKHFWLSHLCQDLGLSLKNKCETWKLKWSANENIFHRFNMLWEGRWWICLTDGISLTVTSSSGGKENLLWSCGMTCVPVDPGQKAGLGAVELMDPSETLLDSSSDLSDCARTIEGTQEGCYFFRFS